MQLSLKKKIFFGSIIILTIIIFSVLICELIFRILLKNEINAYGVGPATNEFSNKYIRLNSKMYRDVEHQLENNAGKFRILALGDSYHFGAGIKNIDDLYFNIIARKLKSKLPKDFNDVEVINISRGGWNIEKYLIHLKKDGLAYKPNAVILGIVFNDIETDLMFAELYMTKLFFISDRIEWLLRNNSYFYYFLESRIDRLLENFGIKKNYIQTLINAYSNNSAEFKNFMNNYLKILELCETEKIIVFTVILPCLAKNKNDMQLINKCMLNFKNAIEQSEKYQNYKNNYKTDLIFDANSIFIDLPYSDFAVSEYDNHPNEKANKLIADYLINCGIIDKLLTLKN